MSEQLPKRRGGAPKGFRPPNAGMGRKKGVQNKATVEIKTIAQQYLPAATRRLAVLAGLVPKSQLRKGEAPAKLETVQVMAIRELFDRGIGKATIPLQHSVGGEVFEAMLLRLGRTPAASLLPPALMIEGAARVLDQVEQEENSIDELLTRLNDE